MNLLLGMELLVFNGLVICYPMPAAEPPGIFLEDVYFKYQISNLQRQQQQEVY